MPLVFDADDRKTISGQLLQLPILVESAEDTAATLGDIEAQLLIDDSDIKLFYDFYNNNVNRYQDERRWLNGTTSTPVLEAQIQTAAEKIDGNLYFPEDWRHFNPFLASPSNLVGAPSGTASDYETRIISDQAEDQGIEFLIDLIRNGQSGATGSGSYDGASSLSVADDIITEEPPAFSVGALILVSTTVVVIVEDNSNPSLLVVSPIIGSGAASGSLTASLPGYNNSQRNTLTGPNQDYLNLISDFIIERVEDWESALNTQISLLNANTDNRSPQDTQNQTALTDTNNALSDVQSWLALPDTGGSGSDSKFTNNHLDDLLLVIGDRDTFATTRSSQINTALGSLSQNSTTGNTTGSGLYLLRYEQLNNRINIIAGPLSEYYEKGEAIRALDEIAEVKGNQLSTFQSAMVATSFIKNGRNSTVIEVVDTTGFSVSDTVYVVSDTQAEIEADIVAIDGLKVILDEIIPDTFLIADKARLLKVL